MTDTPTPADQNDEVKGAITRRETWEARLKAGHIEFADLVRLKYWQTAPEEAPFPELGPEFYDRALDVFKATRRGSGISARYSVDVAIFGAPGCGVLLTPEGTFRYTVMERAIGFDWSTALELLHRVDALTRLSRELWRVETPARPERADPSIERPRRTDQNNRGRDRLESADKDNSSKRTDVKRRRRRPVRRGDRSTGKSRAALTQLRPHSERAYDICTSIFSAINIEKLKREEDPAEKLPRDPSAEFGKRIDLIKPAVSEAESVFRAAAQRYAQIRYGVGMAVGAGVLTLLCIALAVVFARRDVPAWYGVAVVAGGVGAVVSVLQRMASGRLRLDYNAGNGMLVALGAVRPLIGAVFGIVLFAVFDGGWLPSIDVSSDNPLSFYAVVGFLAGFNERFAQDMLVGSARQLSKQLDEVDVLESGAGRKTANA